VVKKNKKKIEKKFNNPKIILTFVAGMRNDSFQNFLKLVSEQDGTMERIKKFVEDREDLKESMGFALTILSKADELGLSEEGLKQLSGLSHEELKEVLSGKVKINPKIKQLFETISSEDKL